MNKHLRMLPNNYFDRDGFDSVLTEVFSSEEELDNLECACDFQQCTDDFIFHRLDDEFYIIHKESGTIITWYKHFGRDNTCNKEGFTLDDLKEFFLLAKEDIKMEC